MIINIPITIDETSFEGKVSQDIENKVVATLVKKIEESIKHYAYVPSWKAEPVKENLLCMVAAHVDEFLDKYKDDIINIAGNELAVRLARRKAGKELLTKAESEEENE